jgi:hypothetical protein
MSLDHRTHVVKTVEFGLLLAGGLSYLFCIVCASILIFQVESDPS